MRTHKNSYTPHGKILSLCLLFLISLVTINSAFSADLNGTVETADGTPITALVLASGRSMFSNTPRGVFSLSGLPLAPDGSINLQVYAAGFYPFFKNITNFKAQSVVMTRAGGLPPVDDGLSDLSPLDGTYRLIRVSVLYDNGDFLDTALDNFSATGTFTILNGRTTQSVSVIINNNSIPVNVSGTVKADLGYGLIVGNSNNAPDSELSLVERGRKLVTVFNATATAVGSNFTEIDYWEKVAGPQSARALTVKSETTDAHSLGGAGGLLGGLIESHGMRGLLVAE